MREQVHTIIAITVLVGIMSVSAGAQNSATTIIANIPFEFNVGDTTMPAGKYTIRCTNPASGGKALVLRSHDGFSVLIMTNIVIRKVAEGGQLVFNRYGDRYFFAQAWYPASSIGMQAPKSRSETKIVRDLASGRPKTVTVTLTPRH